MTNEPQPRYWFRAKRRGAGIGWDLPLTWEGWTVAILWLAGLIAAAMYVSGPRDALLYILFTLIMSAGLLGICYLKGEPINWTWRNRR